MVPIPDDPVRPSQSRDPVRIVVHTALALYLSPVILVVCLVGGTSILATQAARITRRVARKIHRRSDRQPIQIVKTGVGELNPRHAADRERSQIAR
jgi:hypothetical protein